MELRDAAVDAGLPCPHWQQTDVVSLAAESGNCSSTSVLSTYATERNLQRQVDTYQSLNDMFEEQKLETDPILVGPNWIVASPKAPLLAKSMGGTIQR